MPSPSAQPTALSPLHRRPAVQLKGLLSLQSNEGSGLRPRLPRDVDDRNSFNVAPFGVPASAELPCYD